MHNIRGIGKTTRGLRHFGPDVHIVLLQETHLREKDVPPKIDGFEVVHAFAAPNAKLPHDRGKRGLTFAINKALGATSRTVVRTPNVLLHEVKMGDITLIIGNVYVPHDRRRVKKAGIVANPQQRGTPPLTTKMKRQTALEKVRSEDDPRRLAVFAEIDSSIAEQVHKTPNAIWVLAGDFNPSTDGVGTIRNENPILGTHDFKSVRIHDADTGEKRNVTTDVIFTRMLPKTHNVKAISNWEGSSHFVTKRSNGNAKHTGKHTNKPTHALVSDHHTLAMSLTLKGLVTARRQPCKNNLSDGVTPVMGFNQSMLAQGLMGSGPHGNTAYKEQAQIAALFMRKATEELTAMAGTA